MRLRQTSTSKPLVSKHRPPTATVLSSLPTRWHLEGPPPSAKSVAAVDSEVGLAKQSWIKFRRESVLALYTPFLLCLASGNLRVKTFRHYIT
ncbi:hypothetical protein CMV_024584 [Castanea mollissima]|uniref:Uncharacterized protein n=1 Tax=Castanea mollissima TaxID=60419 RepID=A0A8J4VHS9_9ROSI|nr:hypothetical protein CMV_024584 [Castanea mollissima]